MFYLTISAPPPLFYFFLEFRKLLISYGVETSSDDREVRVWDRFRELSGIQKADDVMDAYYVKMMSMSKECVDLADELTEESKKKIDAREPGATLFNPMLLKIDRQGDSITYDVAKRIIKRVESMTKLREVVLVNPHVSE